MPLIGESIAEVQLSNGCELAIGLSVMTTLELSTDKVDAEIRRRQRNLNESVHGGEKLKLPVWPAGRDGAARTATAAKPAREAWPAPAAHVPTPPPPRNLLPSHQHANTRLRAASSGTTTPLRLLSRRWRPVTMKNFADQ